MLAPRRRPTAAAILMTSLSSRRPNDDMGRAWSQVPDSLDATAKRRALFVVSAAFLVGIHTLHAHTFGVSQGFCFLDGRPVGGQLL